MNEFVHISHCKTTKEILDTLEVTHEDHANKVLMTSYYLSDKEHEVSDYEIDDRPSYDELHNVFHELHEEFLKISRKR